MQASEMAAECSFSPLQDRLHWPQPGMTPDVRGSTDTGEKLRFEYGTRATCDVQRHTTLSDACDVTDVRWGAAGQSGWGGEASGAIDMS